LLKNYPPILKAAKNGFLKAQNTSHRHEFAGMSLPYCTQLQNASWHELL